MHQMMATEQAAPLKDVPTPNRRIAEAQTKMNLRPELVSSICAAKKKCSTYESTIVQRTRSLTMLIDFALSQLLGHRRQAKIAMTGMTTRNAVAMTGRMYS